MRRIISAAVISVFILIGSTVMGSEPARMTMAVPDLDWALQFQIEGFQIEHQEFLPDMDGRALQASDSSTGLVLSAFIEPIERDGDAARFRNYTFENLKGSRLKFIDVEKFERGDAAFLDYTVVFAEDRPDFNQRNSYMFLVTKDRWVTIHLSRMMFRPSDQGLFDDFYKTVKIVENYQPSAIGNFVFGNQYYNRKDYRNAVKYYQLALDQEKSASTFPDDLWLVLVDNLGMSYAFTGNLEQSQAIYEYGISMRPDYPMFYYNLGCTYAERGNLAEALRYLKMANERRSNMIPGEVIPDPAEDSSFKKYRKDPQFVELMKTWHGSE
jgi:tetratricopeptide (TPR) repeat protein